MKSLSVSTTFDGNTDFPVLAQISWSQAAEYSWRVSTMFDSSQPISEASPFRSSADLLVEEDAAAAAQGLGPEVLRVVARVRGVDERGGVELHLVHVDEVRAQVTAEVDAVAAREGAVRGGDADEVWAVLLHEAPLGVVEAEAARGDDHRVRHELGNRPGSVLVLDPLDLHEVVLARLPDEPPHLAGGLHLDAFHGLDGEACMLHDRVAHRHGHPVGPRWHTMRPLLGVAPELRERSEWHPQLVHEPVDALGTPLREYGDAAQVVVA
eukprot:CAMPEP_0179372818 /NCGR_PEP_ID=MMETSP0797-20121207/86490_1 /TAXON_ID=47934 /ORGANISM="Dinophysis acuminata, Strain DAEP01" /LENGTH=266 /DNA_ID=CAMNT_0021088819 /DNA_START=58 /DNA_END=854 /DNA_ORIENTATION=+